MWALQGGIGVVGGLLFGRFNSERRERSVLIATATAQAIAIALMATVSWPGLVAGIVLTGLTIGPSDVSMFSLRQRSTPVAWFGRAFAISMSLNYAGAPIGSALAGPLLRLSVEGALLAGAAFLVASAILAALLIPATPEEPAA
jgi:predicted MFS family arabinose efflux permease